MKVIPNFSDFMTGDCMRRLYQRVRLMTDKYVSDGIKKGDIGVILEDYGGNNYEVEFFDDNGITIALFAFPQNELEFVE